MKRLRNSKIIQGIYVFLAFAILNISCTSELDTIPETPISQKRLLRSNSADLEIHNDLAFDFVRSMSQQTDSKNYEELLTNIFGDQPEIKSYSKNFQREMNRYKKLGFERYISQIDKYSSEVKSYFKDYEEDLDDLLRDENFNYSKLDNFFLEQISGLQNAQLSADENKTMMLFLNTSQNMAKHYFQFVDFSLKKENACNNREAVKCILMAIAVGFAVGALVSQIPFLGPIIVKLINSKGGLSDLLVPDISPAEATTLIFVVAGVWSAVKFFDWCCEEIGSELVQECEEPTGFSYYSHDCGNFKVFFFGPSEYALTTWGSNVNVNPVTATTPSPSLNISVPTMGDESEFYADILCIPDSRSPGSNTQTYSMSAIETIIYNGSLPNLIWGIAPPNNAVQGQTYEISLSGTNHWSNVTWHVTTGGGITSTGDYTANLTFFTSGNKTVTATATDNCTGETRTLSKEVFVQ